ncbi:maleate cis-trans isomerase family protein [Actinokineospora sp. NPDC004072]
MLNRSWGWRAALGILVIDHDPVAESEFAAMAPVGVSVNAARFESPRKPGTADYGTDPARRVAESADVRRGLAVLGGMRLDAVCVCFTTSSFLGGVDFDRRFAVEAGELTGGIPVLTAATATVRALAAVGITRPFVLLPPWFKDEIAEAGAAYLAAAGFPPAGLRRYDLGRGWRDLPPWATWDAGAQWEVRPDEVYRQVRTAVPADADGVLVAGNGLRCVDAIAPLEADTGLPVVTSNQACLWECLRMAGTTTADVTGYGRLFTA